MRLAAYTLTRDRLDYTKRMFEQLKDCGMKFDHYVLDNGSTDGTKEYLKTLKLKGLYFSPDNKGLWQGINTILRKTEFFNGYELVLKLDNDLEFPEKDWLRALVDTYDARDYDCLTPFVEGICNGQGGADRMFDDMGIGVVAHCGGASLLTKAKFYKALMPEDRPKARGWDTWFCQGKKCGIVEDIHIKHDTVKQEQDKPDYYQRKIKESTEVYGS